MIKLCNFHPDKPAKYECKHCGIAWCRDCVDTNTIQTYGITGAQSAQYFCPKCNRPVKRIVVQEEDRFWDNGKAIFLNPLEARFLMVMLPISVAIAILASLGVHSLVFLLLWGTIVFFAVQELEESAGNTGFLSAGKARHLKHYAVQSIKHFLILGLLFAGFNHLTATVGTAGGITFFCLAAATVPAILTILFITGSAIKAFNPNTIQSTIQKLGEKYIFLALLPPLFLFMSTSFGYWIGDIFTKDAKIIFLSLAAQYFTLVHYLFIGFTINHCRKELATLPEFKCYLGKEDGHTESTQDQMLGIVDQLVAEHRLEDALACIEAKNSKMVFDVALAERYYDLLKKADLPEKLLEHARLYLDLLAAEGKEDELCRVYLASMAEDPHFAPSPSTLFTIAKLLGKRGKHRSAVSAFYQFRTAYPASTFTPKALLLAATVLHEQMKESEQAIDVLKDMVNTYPDYHLAREARNYLKTLMKKVRQQKGTIHSAPVYELHALKKSV